MVWPLPSLCPVPGLSEFFLLFPKPCLSPVCDRAQFFTSAHRREPTAQVALLLPRRALVTCALLSPHSSGLTPVSDGSTAERLGLSLSVASSSWGRAMSRFCSPPMNDTAADSTWMPREQLVWVTVDCPELE